MPERDAHGDERPAASSVRHRLTAVSQPRCDLLDGQPSASLLQEWDELAVSTGAPPWARPGWVVPWWRCFGGSPVAALLRGPDGGLRALLPLQRARSGLVSPTNWHTPEFTPVAVDEQACDDVLALALARCGSRVTVDFVRPELAERLGHAARRSGGWFASRVLESSPYLHLAPGWEQALDGHLLAELRRRERRLRERGDVVVDLSTGQVGLPALLEQGLSVEASGWKGRHGSAIASCPATREFYLSVARWTAEQGLLRLSFLRLDGRALAFGLAVEHAGAQFLLKTGYDETARSVAPGKLLTWHVLQDCAARGVGTYEFLGHVQPWKHEWTPLRRDRLQAHAFPRRAAGLRAWVVYAGALPAARVARDRFGRTVEAVRAHGDAA